MNAWILWSTFFSFHIFEAKSTIFQSFLLLPWKCLWWFLWGTLKISPIGQMKVWSQKELSLLDLCMHPLSHLTTSPLLMLICMKGPGLLDEPFAHFQITSTSLIILETMAFKFNSSDNLLFLSVHGSIWIFNCKLWESIQFDLAIPIGTKGYFKIVNIIQQHH